MDNAPTTTSIYGICDGASKRDVRVHGRRERRPRIGIVAYNVSDDNGTGRVWAELLRHASADFDFTVVSSFLGESLRPLVKEWVKIKAPERPFPLRFVTFWIRAGTRVRSLDVDLVHASGAIIPNRVDATSIHFCHAGFVRTLGRPAPKGTPPGRLVNATIGRGLALAAERWCYRPNRLRAFAVVSHGAGEEVLRHYRGIAMYVTPNGVDHARFRPDPYVRAQVRHKMEADDALVAVFVGGDWHLKGLQITIEALARVRKAGIDLRLWVVGTGDDTRFSRIANELGLMSTVTFLGAQDYVERFLAGADMFVLPSEYETFSLVAYEAAASALPVVATRVHGINELLMHGDAGILVDRTPESVADALVQLARDPDLRERLGYGALQRSTCYTWLSSAKAVMTLYRSLLAMPTEKMVTS